MTPNERDLLRNLFERLRDGGNAQAEPEAAAFIADAVARQPDAPYRMAQVLLLQDQALAAAQARIAALEQAARGGQNAKAASPERRFLPDVPDAAPASARRPWDPRPAGDSAAASAAGAGTRAAGTGELPVQGIGTRLAGSSGTSSFLQGALQTAAGVAGGALLFEGVNALLHRVTPLGLGSGGWFGAAGGPTLIEETIITGSDQGEAGFLPHAATAAGGGHPDAGDVSEDAFAPESAPEEETWRQDVASGQDDAGAAALDDLADDPGDDDVV